MTKIAVIKTGGKQYKVKVGQSIKIEKLKVEPGTEVNFETLLVADTDGKNIEIGQPSLGEKVTGKLIDETKSKKVMVVKYKNKTRYLKSTGHRQTHAKVEITKIS